MVINNLKYIRTYDPISFLESAFSLLFNVVFAAVFFKTNRRTRVIKIIKKIRSNINNKMYTQNLLSEEADSTESEIKLF